MVARQISAIVSKSARRLDVGYDGYGWMKLAGFVHFFARQRAKIFEVEGVAYFNQNASHTVAFIELIH